MNVGSSDNIIIRCTAAEMHRMDDALGEWEIMHGRVEAK
jgi:hypothetical protein